MPADRVKPHGDVFDALTRLGISRVENSLADLARQLAEQSKGEVEWRVQNPESKSYCISFSWRDTSDPERRAREWLADHRRDFPNGRFADYEVAPVIVQTQHQVVMHKAAERLAVLKRMIGTAVEAAWRNDRDGLVGALSLLQNDGRGDDGEPSEVVVVAGASRSNEDGAELQCHRACTPDAEETSRLALPKLPPTRMLASGVISGRAVELRGWHEEDLTRWSKAHGLNFGETTGEDSDGN